jgi:putative nucleotidyltransferase with HDIG domain
LSSEPRTRVLVLDDDPPFANLVAELLQQRGYETLVAHDAEAAVAHARAGTLDAAVVDLGLPGTTGLEVADRLRVLSPDVEIVILTGQGSLASAVEGLHHGIFDYLQKGGLQLTELARSVHQAVERSQLSRENHRLVAEMSEANRLMRSVQEASTRMAAETHLDRLLPLLASAAQSLTDAVASRVLLFSQATPEAWVVALAAGNAATALPGARLRRGEGLALAVALGNEAIRVADASADPRYAARCDDLGVGAASWLAAPLHHGSVLGAVIVAGRLHGFGEDRAALLTSLARLAALAIENSFQHERAINFFTHTSDLLVGVLERLDIHYPGHSRRVAALADMLSRRMGLSETDRRGVHFGALLHDIGKVRIDHTVLTADHTSPEVRRELERHPALGLEILRSITLFEDVLPIVHSHHERWDGKGYPRGLVGEEIPLGARIVAVADAFDAMTHHTPHGRFRTSEEALVEVEACAGSQFDPRVARLFAAEFREHGEGAGL